MSLPTAIEKALGERPTHIQPLTGGCVGDVSKVEFTHHPTVVSKTDPRGGQSLHIEAAMLEALRPHLPVPEVLSSTPDLLLLEWIPGRSTFCADAEEHAAELLANLHRVASKKVGWNQDTLIGGLDQPNPWTTSWVEFFGTSRLLAMAGAARRHGTLPASIAQRVERLIPRLRDLLPEPATPALLHGDVWSGNVLADSGRIRAFLDPAIYFGHAEVELAFIGMFQTFGSRFYDAYNALIGIEAGFDERRDLYNLYPYLVHARLFGGSYVDAVDGILSRYDA